VRRSPRYDTYAIPAGADVVVVVVLGGDGAVVVESGGWEFTLGLSEPPQDARARAATPKATMAVTSREPMGMCAAAPVGPTTIATLSTSNRVA